MTSIIKATDRLNEIIHHYMGFSDSFLPDLDAWDAKDLAEIETLMNAELQRRFDERSSRGLLN